MFPTGSDFESEFTFENPAVPLPEEPPFHVLLLGDWSGTNRKNLNDRRPLVIDRDNFDEVLKKMNVGLDLDLQGDGKDVLPLQFAEIDDFHPDNLFRQVSLFSDLRDIRRRLANPDTFDSAANEVRSWFNNSNESVKTEAEIETEINDAPPIDSNNLLDMILTQPSDSTFSRNPQKVDNSELGRLISKIVSPYLIKIDENEQSRLIATVDESIAELMRTILHHPKFQALESAWRGLYFLVRRLETDVDLKVFILDLSKDELIANLKSVNSLSDSFLYRWLITESIETSQIEPFAVVGGNYSFGVNVDDVASLLRIAKLANGAAAPFISYIQPEIFGITDFSEKIETSRFEILEDSNEAKLWTALRSSTEAGYLGLSPMKILTRMPYGEKNDSIEAFSFEEFTEKNDHNEYLWMNPCFAVALLLAQSYRLYGWEMGQALRRDIENLPMHVYQEDGETKTKPCAEVVLTENMLETLLGAGLMPLISFRDSDKVRLSHFQSISSLSGNLSGRWNL
jgi:type VI secretion system protein ImpC